MSRGRDLLKNTGILMIAKISTQFMGFLLLPLYTALLTTEEYGIVDICTSMIMIIVPFVTLQLEMALFRFFITEELEEQRKTIVTSAFMIILVLLVVASGIYWCMALVIYVPYKVYLYFMYLTATVSTVLLQICRAYGNNKLYGFASFISSVFALCLNVVFVLLLHWHIEGILLSYIIAHGVSSLYMVVKTKVFKYIDKRSFSREESLRLLNYSIPLVFNQISSWAINYSDRLVILNAWGAGANGIYSVSNKFSNIANTFFNVYNIAWTENVIRGMKDQNNQVYVNKIFTMTFNLYLILVTGTVNVLPFFFNRLVNANYQKAYGHVPILMLAMFFSGMSATIGSVYIAYNKTKDVTMTTVLAGVCNIVIHLILLKRAKLYAASISTLLSFVLLFIYRLIFVQRFSQIKFNVKKMFPQIAIFIVAWLGYSLKNYFVIIIAFGSNMMCIFFVLLKNKNEIFKLIKR